MANVLTDWRTALETALAAAFPTAEVMGGVRRGVSRDKPRIAVFPDPAAQGHMADRIVVGTPRMIVRYWPKRSELPARELPPQTDDLEQARYDVETTLRGLQTSLGVTDLWYFLVESSMIDPDPEEWGVEVKLVGYGRNVAAIA